MEFRQRGQRDERRRRVLIDDGGADSNQRAGGPAATTSDKTKKSPTSGRLYCEGAITKHQPRTTDLLPKRWWVFGLLFLLVASLAVGINVLGHNHADWSASVSQSNLSAIDLAAPGNLVAWFSSTLLMLATVVCWQIYALRRHKVDDYRGRYRLWLWTGAFLLLASIDATAGLHHIVHSLLVQSTGTTLLGDGSIWWMICFGVIFGAIAVRMGIEIRRSWAAVAALCITLSSYTVAALATLQLIGGSASALVAANGAMIGHISLLFCAALYARFVYNQARSATVKLNERATKQSKARANNSNDEVRVERATIAKKEQEVPKPTVKADAKVRQPAANNSEQQPAKTKSNKVKSEADSADAGDASSQNTTHPSRLSKSQRKRLRKQQRREQDEQRPQKAA